MYVISIHVYYIYIYYIYIYICFLYLYMMFHVYHSTFLLFVKSSHVRFILCLYLSLSVRIVFSVSIRLQIGQACLRVHTGVCLFQCVVLSSFPYSVGRPVFLTFLVSISLSVCPSRFLFHASNHARTYVSFVSINVLPLILASCFVASFVVRCVCCVFCVPIFLPYQGSWSHNTHKVNRVVGLVGLVG